MRHEQGVLVLEAVEILQDRRAVVVKTVVAPPLQETNLHGNLREFIGVGIDFNGTELLHADLRRKFETKLRRKRDDFLFESKQQLKRDVKEIAAAARGVENGHGGEFFLERGELVALRGVALAFGIGGGESALDLAPFTAERRHEHGFNERLDVRFAGIVRAKL